MIDFNKLNSQFDLNNLDAEQLTRALSEHQNSLIKLVLIVGTLILAGVMFNGHRVKEQGLRTQMSQMQDKLDVIKATMTAVKEP